jgi:predicted ATPase
VLLSGEAGIGKSSLVDGLRDHVRQAGFTRITIRCSPYHTNSAFYSIIEHVQRALGWQPEDPVETRLAKLEQALAGTSLPLEEAAPLLASLLSLPLPEGRYPDLSVSPEQQRQQTQDVLVSLLLEEAERHPVLAVWEDLHWADPSTLENLGLLVEQTPTVAMLHVLTFRPEFAPPWPSRSHLTPITLNRLERPQVEALVQRLAGGKQLPEEVVAHIVGKTDGVPLYVEELTKMLLASDLLREDVEQYVLTGLLLSMAIPDTLQDSLMARLDQMKTAKEVAQLGAVLGREFAYEMLQALSSQDDETVQTGLAQLVEAELLYQRGRPPRARYVFKHALIQDAAYASLLRSTRQRVHQQIAQLFETRCPEVVEAQPEVVAHHYTEAACPEQAIGYWQQAGQQAARRAANQEAVRHLSTGLELLATLLETPERIQQELDLRVALASVLTATNGYASPEAEHAYARAWALCQRLGESPQRFPVLYGLCAFYFVGGKPQQAREQAEEFLRLALRQEDAAPLVVAHRALGMPLYLMGEVAQAREHFAQGVALYDAQQHRMLAFSYVQDPGVAALVCDAWALWALGYPAQALRRSHAARRLAEELAHPLTLAYAFCHLAMFHQYRRDWEDAHQYAEAAIRVSREQSFPYWLEVGLICQGWARTTRCQFAELIPSMHEGMARYRATGAVMWVPYFLTLLAEVYDALGQVETGLPIVAEALDVAGQTGERWYEAETYRLKGTLLLRQPDPDTSQAEACFQQAIAIARRQEAKSWELRAAASLARLWQAQDKLQDAHDLLAPVYGWFTEGFDTADLMDARALLDELSTEVKPPMA